MAIKYHESSRGRVAYDKRGLGDPLLLLHGLYPGASHHEFHHNISELARHFTVYAIDLLGFGQSDMPRMTYTVQFYQHLLREFIVEEIGGPTHVIANEGSCGPAVQLAVYNVELVRKLVLIDPIIDPSQSDQSPSVAAKVHQFLMGTLSMGLGLYEAVASEFELEQFLRSRYARPKPADLARVPELHERALQRHAMHAFISNITGHLSLDVPRWLRYVRAQVLIIWGREAGPPPIEQLLQPASWSKGKRIELIENAAHWPHDEQSAKVNRLVVEFLNEEAEVLASPA